MAWWVTFADRSPGCVEGTRVEAKAIADGFGAVSTMEPLPYPAVPRLGPRSDTPSFCTSPSRCAGRGSCPKPYACND